ncbi:MAG: hypothetical protein Q9219_004001 [cf. Caloplaca sp. 3 TL-2023]
MSKKQFKSQASSSRASAGAFAAADNAPGAFNGAFKGSFGAIPPSPLSYVYEPPDLSRISEPSIIVAFKNIQKKDSTTKAKALEELQKYITGLDPKDGLDDAVPETWIKVYPRTSIDTARRVRQLAHQLQGALAHTSGKRFARAMPDVVGAWLAGIYDGDRTVSNAAKDSLKQVFQTEKKIKNVWNVYLGSILQYCSDALFNESIHTLSDERTVSPDDAFAKHARVVSAAIHVMRHIIDNTPQDALSKQQGALEDFLSRPELWKFSSHADPPLRRAVYTILGSSLTKYPSLLDLGVISNCVLVSSLDIRQASSALEYSRILARLTVHDPSVWTDHYKGTGKKAATKRLCQYLSRGSQGGSPACWGEIGTILLNVPVSVLLPRENIPDQKFVVLEALREGITNRDEPRANQQAAWDAYLNLANRFLSVTDVDRDLFIDDNILPLLVQYIKPSRETSSWTASASQEPIMLNAARIALTSEQVLVHRWRALSEALVQDIQISLPEQSKDFAKSQDAISSKANRWYSLQKALRDIKISSDFLIAISDTTVSEIEAAVALLKARGGKPYGAASLIESAVRLLPEVLSDHEDLKRLIVEFFMADASNFLLSPSGPYLVGLIPFLEQVADIGPIFRSSLQTALQAPESIARSNVLQRLAASPCLRRLDQDPALLEEFSTSLQRAVYHGDGNNETFKTALVNSDSSSRLTQDLLSKMLENLSSEESQSASLRGLETIVSRAPDAIKTFDASTDGATCLSRLIALADSPEYTLAQRATDLVDVLRADTATNPEGDQAIIKIIRRSLDIADPDALSVTSLIGLAHKILQQCNEEDKVALVEALLPDEPRWKSLLQPILSTRPNPALAIMNLIGTAVSLVEGATMPSKPRFDGAGQSAAFRLFWFTSALMQSSDISKYASKTARASVFRNLAIVAQIASDRVSIQTVNSLWEQQMDPRSEEDISEIVNQTQRLLASWLAVGYSDSSIAAVLSSLLEDSRGMSVTAYYSSRAYISMTTNLNELHTQLEYDIGNEELRSVKNTADIFTGIAIISAIQDFTLLSRMFNELLGDLTGHDFRKFPNSLANLVTLNSILSKHEFKDVLFGVPKQRLIFFVQHVCTYLVELSSEEPKAFWESQDRNIVAESMRALNQILPALNETYGSFWNDIVHRLLGLWSSHAPKMDEIVPLTHASLRLYSTLAKLCIGKSNEDLIDALSDNQRLLGLGMIGLVTAFQDLPDDSHQPRRMINELLARQVSSVKDSISEDETASKSMYDLFPALASESVALQGAAYALLHLQIPKKQENISLDKALSKDFVAKLPEELLSLVIETPSMDNLADADFKRAVPASLRSYLLSWHLIFDHWVGASDAVKNDYISNVKEGSYVNGLLGLASDFLITSRIRPVDASGFDIEYYRVDYQDTPEKDAQWLLTHLYYLALKYLPTLSKSWWRDHTSRQTQLSVESWTEKYISPRIAASELSTVSGWSATREEEPDQPLTVKISTSTREITASIPIDEQAMSLAISLPPSYPLARATVSGIHRVGVTEQKWRSWIITTQGVINFSDIGGGGQLIDGLMAWRKNVTAALKGQTECAICYSVIEVTKTCQRSPHPISLSADISRSACRYRLKRNVYMCDLKRTLDAGGHCVLEMPSGTGKTVSLLSLIVAYQQYYPEHRKLIYCSRTMSEIEKALAELKALMKYRADQLGYVEDFRGLGLTSRKNLCLHPSVKREKSGSVVDARCRSLTAGFVKEKKERGEDVDLCIYHDNLDLLEPHNLVPPGVFTLDGMLKYGEQHKQCPYFSVRRMMPFCNVIIYSYHYLLDPKIAERVSKELSKDCIVVFDEAHNIDNVCIESLSIDLTEDSLRKATRGANNLERKITEMRSSDAEKLQNEYSKLVEGLRDADEARDENAFMANPALPDDLLQEAVPGNIRRAEHFVAFLKRFVEYLKTRMQVRHVISETPPSFLQHLKELTFIERKPLRFCAERLTSLVRTLELTNIEDYQPLQEVATFATLAATYDKGFLLILEPFESDTATVPNPILHFTCLDAAIAIKPVFDRFSSVIITSGTISPLEMYPKMLGFNTVVQESYSMTLARSSFLPMIVTRGSDQSPISSSFQIRNEPGVVRNYGALLTEFSKITPDGLVVFFPSYLYMESIISMWQRMEILDEIWKHKLILVETPDSQETSLALETYRTACCNGRGAILLCVARGKVSEGIDFDHHYGRTVLCIGVPFQYTESRILKARLEFLRETYRIRENDFLSFDAMRHAAQCLGRVLRGKDDYGIMVLADRRFAKKRSQLPKWINQAISEEMVDVSTESAVVSGKRFMRVMAQPFSSKDQDGISTWSAADLARHKEKVEEEKIRELRMGKGVEKVGEMDVDGDGDEYGYDEGLDRDMDAAMEDVGA